MATATAVEEFTEKQAAQLLKTVTFPITSDAERTRSLSLIESRNRKDIVKGRQQYCEQAAAIELQRIWRGHRTRRLFKEILGPLLVDTQQQQQQQLQPLPRIEVDAVLTDNRAAEIIQRSWRKFRLVKVYRFYRDLINFNGQGEPALMLRCINPKEAPLLDRAAGVRIRFRLGGETFPPNVYYKIFTYRNIVDLCACSPRDYTAMNLRKPSAKDVHNKAGHQPQPKPEADKSSWYQRWENNGWRLVPTRLFSRTDQDSIQNDTTRQRREFSHSKLKRREDVERKRKERKIQWLSKMYKQGMMEGAGLHDEDHAQIKTTTQQILELAEREGVDVIEDCDVDELLSWTNGLSFDDYSMNWQVLGTSTTSEETDIHQRLLSIGHPQELLSNYTASKVKSDPPAQPNSHNVPSVPKRASTPTLTS